MKKAILIIDCGSSKVPLFSEKLASFGQESTVVPLEQVNGELALPYAGIIISGAPILITEKDPKPYQDQLSFLTTFSKPILGVCFGHQILGLLHGATVYKCEPARTDMTIDKRNHSKLWDRIDDFSFNQDHCEAIDLPEGWIHLASSRVCTNEAMEHPEKSLFGVQFHPESSGDNGTQLLKNFCKSCF